jgi:Tol biopolymer transport system component
MDEGREAQLLVEGVRDVSPAWLLDGSGFIFVDDDFGSSGDNIYSYDLNTRESEQLTYFNEVLISNIRISSDSGHILFTRCSDPSHCSLWIMDRLNPVEMWPITDEGHIDSPDWSRVEVAGSNSQNNDSDDSGGSGGCFIKCVIGAP